MKPDMANTVVIVPAFNEEACIGGLVREIHGILPGIRVVVINDGSEDRTGFVARNAGAEVLDLPCNVGVGGAVQAGFRYACEQGFQYVVRIDGDGQHPPAEIPHLMAAMDDPRYDMAVGSRFAGKKSYTSTLLRYCGIFFLARMLSVICRKRVTDPTSGFQILARPLMYFFSRYYPADYPEPEAIALMRRQGYDLVEVPVTFRERASGSSTINGWGTLYYLVKVFLALLVDRARPVDPRYARANIERVV